MKKLSKQITLGIDPYSGKRVRKRIYSTTKAGLVQAEKDAIREFAKHGISSSMTFGAYKKQWWQAYCTTLQPVTQRNYETCLKWTEKLDNRQMSKITHTDLQQIIKTIWGKENLAAKLSRLLRAIWRSAVLDGVVEKNIADNLKRPKIVKSERRALTNRELEAVQKADMSPQDRFLTDLLLQFGLRPGEALALNVHDFNRKERTLTISKSLAHDHNMPFIKPTKTGVSRVLPVPDSFWSKIPKVRGMFYFTDDNGNLLKESAVSAMGHRITNAINAKLGGTSRLRAANITLYTFRHNKATQLYYLPGVSLKKKAEYMGHSEKMFIQTYTHLDDTKEEIEALRNAM